MPTPYEPKDHIQPLEVAPRPETVLDQREITFQTYDTGTPFDFAALDAGLRGGGLSPAVRFGVFTRHPSDARTELRAVLGLLGEISVRAYDFDERRPLWFSWRDLIVETMAIRYTRNDAGHVRFTTAGGGARISEGRLHEFHSAFLKIPGDAVHKLQYDSNLLRGLCFERFGEKLYTLRFSNPSASEYRSIDHALFQSRRYIDPSAERYRELRDDPQLQVESFESDLLVATEDLATPAEVRFSIRGLSGALWLRFPKMTYKAQVETVEEQTRVFYGVVDETVKLIHDANYYLRRQLSLAELEKNPQFPEFADLMPYRQALSTPVARKELLTALDLGAPRHTWLPPLRALDQLLAAEVVGSDVAEAASALVLRDPNQAVRLLDACRTDGTLTRVGRVAAEALHARLQEFTPATRGQIEELLLAWAVDRETDEWEVDPATGVISVRGLRWKAEDLSIDILPAVVWKLVGLLHARLKAATGNVAPDLRRYAWCMAVAKGLAPNHCRSPSALRLVAAGRAPRTVTEGARILKEAVSSHADFDDAVLNQFGLPLWPHFRAARKDGGIVLTNDGVGAALGVTTRAAGALFGEGAASSPSDLLVGESVDLPAPGIGTALEVSFGKFGGRYSATVPVAADGKVVGLPIAAALPRAIDRQRLAAQREYRRVIDPGCLVVGASLSLLRIFEDIHHANLMDGGAPVLILGERGVGKSHIAKLLHDSSRRAGPAYKHVNAGVGGGDPNMQRGEWIGIGRGHGLSGLPPEGKRGHLMEVDGGTLFVDEFAVFSQELQVLFLSVLERSGVQKVGGETFVPDVRCIFATNAEIDELVQRGTLRRDLLARIPVRIHIPPLRERRGDILLLSRHFAGADRPFSERTLVALVRYGWPDNVRELKAKLSSAVAKAAMKKETRLDLAHLDLPAEIKGTVEGMSETDSQRELWTLADEVARGEGLEPGSGLQRRAGEILGVGESQASKRYKQFGLGKARD